MIDAGSTGTRASIVMWKPDGELVLLSSNRQPTGLRADGTVDARAWMRAVETAIIAAVAGLLSCDHTVHIVSLTWAVLA
ncbi:MAG: hypothetical protein EOO65_03735, partial [Methanosarcinales archaeon]